MYHKNIQRIIRSIGAMILVFIFAFLLYQDLVPTGMRTIVYENTYTPIVESWSPPKRTRGTGGGMIEMLTDPVYLGIHLPRRFETVTMRVWYKDPENTLTHMGPRLKTTTFDQWEYNVLPIENGGTDGEWDIAKITSPLLTADFTKNIYTFIFSAPGLDKTDAKILIKKIEFVFTRESFSWNKVKRFLNLQR